MINAIVRMVWKIRLSRRCSRLLKCGRNFNAGRGLILIGAEHIRVGDDFSAGQNLNLAAYPYYRGQKTGGIPQLIIGSNVSFMDNCAVSCMDRIIIGDGVLFGANVFVTDNFHGKSSKEELHIPPGMRTLYSKGPVIIGKNVWVGRNVCIMPGVAIGDGSVIGANAVVTKDIPPGCVAAGLPARVIRRV